MMRTAFAEAGLRDIAEEEVSTPMSHPSAERYWEIMNDIAAPVVAGLAKADDATREAIRTEVLDLARKHMRDGAVQLQSTAMVVSGTR